MPSIPMSKRPSKKVQVRLSNINSCPDNDGGADGGGGNLFVCGTSGLLQDKNNPAPINTINALCFNRGFMIVSFK